MHDVLHDLALPSIERYAELWRWDVHVEDLPSDGSGADPAEQQAKWAKIRMLREALATYDLVLWLDADVLVLRDDEDVARHLHPTHFQALAFLDAVERTGPQPGPWADQGAVRVTLGWDRGDIRYHWARPGPGSALAGLPVRRSVGSLQ